MLHKKRNSFGVTAKINKKKLQYYTYRYIFLLGSFYQNGVFSYFSIELVKLFALSWKILLLSFWKGKARNCVWWFFIFELWFGKKVQCFVTLFIFWILFGAWFFLQTKKRGKMVPQQQDSPSSSGMPLFGSLLVDKNSSTPYSDATQVKWDIYLLGWEIYLSVLSLCHRYMYVRCETVWKHVRRFWHVSWELRWLPQHRRTFPTCWFFYF